MQAGDERSKGGGTEVAKIFSPLRLFLERSEKVCVCVFICVANRADPAILYFLFLCLIFMTEVFMLVREIYSCLCNETLYIPYGSAAPNMNYIGHESSILLLGYFDQT